MTDHNRNPADDELAQKRWMILNLVRIGGLALVLLALAVHYGKIPLPPLAAYVLAAVGLFEFFVLPGLLARKWKSPKP